MADDYADLRQRLDEMAQRRRHRHHKTRHHHHHSGVTPHDEPCDDDDLFPPDHELNLFPPPQGDGDMHVHEAPITNNDNRVTNVTHSHAAPIPAPSGTGAAEALRRVLEAVNGLASRRDRHTCLGIAIARLTEQDRIAGLADVAAVMFAEVNRFAHVSDDLPRATRGYRP